MILISGIIASLIQTDGFNALFRELLIQTDSGYTMCAYLFVPKNATAEPRLLQS